MARSAGNDPHALEAFLAAPAAEITTEALGRISGPALVLIGDRDWLGPASLIAASLPDSQLVTLARTDHFATVTRVEALMAALRFLAG